jgi:hypothetical protein
VSHFVLTPAYGRDYKSKKEALADFEANKDFQHASAPFTGGGAYINKQDIPAGSRVQIRYKKLTQLCVVEVK